ncbi:hypothetical protein ACGF13_38475 [Kitasatospora sp. NPDC048286]|uniref:hypothetical protein n=1 Tax=Kitasatospora sp. NPDC048286 TaxID=3364047 RepID=UPI003716CE2F
MHTPPPASSPSPDGDGTSYEDAKEAIGAVIAWCSRELMAARRLGDRQRQQDLAAQLQVCGEDRKRLADAGPGEIGRITELYAERLKFLQAAGNE